MVGPGSTYAEMITGDWIASRHTPVTDTAEPTGMF
jgi:acetolactate synthase-1/2/3 large subunit